jgi:hypothetical protein
MFATATPDATAIVRISDREIPAFRWFSSEISLTAKPGKKISYFENVGGDATPEMPATITGLLPVFFHKIASGFFVL